MRFTAHSRIFHSYRADSDVLQTTIDGNVSFIRHAVIPSLNSSIYIVKRFNLGSGQKLYGPGQGKKCPRACAKCSYSDDLVHAQSIIRAFALHSHILQYPMILLADSEGPDQTAWSRRLIWAFTVRI